MHSPIQSHAKAGPCGWLGRAMSSSMPAALYLRLEVRREELNVVVVPISCYRGFRMLSCNLAVML